MDKLKRRFSAFALSLLMLLTLFPAIPAQAAASYGLATFSKVDGYSYYFDSSFPAPFYGTRYPNFYMYTINQDGSGNYKLAYCIEYGVDTTNGANMSRTDSYSSLSTEQKDLLNKVLIMGYNENTGALYGGTWQDNLVATQAMVWIVTTGYYGTSDESRIADAFLASSPTARGIYNTMKQKVDGFETIPSFAGGGQYSAPEHELKYNTTNGRYEITLNDTNGVLQYFDFSASGISFTCSGNRLTISTTQVLEQAIITANKNLPSEVLPSLLNGRPEYWTSGTWQNFASLNIEAQPLQVAAVLKLSTEKLGHINIVKQSEDGIVAGLQFRVQGNGIDKTFTTGAGGEILIENLVAGSYTVTETSTPNRYVQPASQVVTVEPGRTATVNFSNVLKKFYIYITKSDTATGTTPQGDATLDGAVYEIYNASGKLVERVKAEGRTARSSLLVLGTYTIYEVEPPTGYNLNTLPMAVTGDFDGQTVEIGRADTGIADNVIMGQIALSKFADAPLTGGGNDGNGSRSQGLKTPLEGIEFTFTLVSSGAVTCTIATDADGYAITPMLPYGTYRVEETKGAEGYRNIEPFEVFIDTHGKIYRYILENTVYTQEVKIVKVDAETGTAIPLAGTTFKIKDSAGQWVTQSYNYPTPTTIDEYQTAEDGSLVLPHALPAGSYWLYEIKAPYGYTVAEEPIPFTISSADQSVLLEVVSANQPVKGTVTIEKLGEYLAGFEAASDFGSTWPEVDEEIYQPIYRLKGVPGTVYDIVAVNDIVTPDGTLRAEAGAVVAQLTTGADGRATSPELYLGQYQLIEREVPAGFVLDETPLPFALTYADQNTALVHEYEWQQNERQRALVQLLKDAEAEENQSYNPYPDILFGLYTAEDFVNSRGEVVLPADSLLEILTLDELGAGVVQTDLPLGTTYYVVELATGEGYMLNDTRYSFAVVAGATDTPVVKIAMNDGEGIPNALMRGRLRILKTAEDGKVEGIEFRVTGLSTNGTPYEQVFTTDENGEIHIEGLLIGTYEVVELLTEATVGYIRPDGQTVKICQGEEATAEFENILIRGGVQLTKTDMGGQRLAGAVFGLYTAEGELLEEFTIGESGEHTVDGLLFGSYYLLEHEAPANYELSEMPFLFSITEDGVTIEITAENEPKEGGVRLTKHEAATSGQHGPKLSGAVFSLYAVGEDGSMELLSEGHTTGASGTVEVEGLTFGQYAFVETKAPANYVLDDTPITFTIDEDTTEGYTVFVEVAAANDLATGGVRLTKTDSGSGAALAGAVFNLYAFEDGKAVLLAEGMETDTDGIIELDGLTHGQYAFMETAAPLGYLLPEDTVVYFTIDEDTTQGYTVFVEVAAENERATGGVQLTKTDGATEALLAGAVFDLYSVDALGAKTLVSEGHTTGADGTLTVDGLTRGRYAFVETAAPAGYVLPSNAPVYFTIDEDTTEGYTLYVALTVTNEAEPVEPEPETPTGATPTRAPQTGDGANLPALLAVVGASGVCLILALLKKRGFFKKKK